jgi:DNA-binding NarL/FixJ family response regulator
VVAGVAVLTAGWHLGLWRLGINEQRTELVLVYLTGLFTLWFVLAGIHPAYFSLLLVMYPQIFRHLRLTLAVPAAVALTVEVVWREVLASGQPLSENPPAIAGGLVSVVFGSLFAFWLTRIIDQSYERRRLIEQLEATRSELDAAEREGGRLAERQRLAHDIHDTLAKGFVSIVLQLQAAEADLPDHPVVRDGLRGMLASKDGFQVVGEAASGAEAVAVCHRERPDVVLMDLQMPEMDGATATAEITARFPETRVPVLTTYDTDADILRAVEAGATGYLLKDTPRERLFPAIQAAARGETVLAPAVATRLVSRMRRPATEALTAREVEVLELVARGSSNADIAAALFISEATVKTHLLHSFAKLGVDDRTAAVVAAPERGIIALPRRRT